jgi:hypothetical protein
MLCGVVFFLLLLFFFFFFLLLLFSPHVFLKGCDMIKAWASAGMGVWR